MYKQVGNLVYLLATDLEEKEVGESNYKNGVECAVAPFIHRRLC